MLPQEFTDGQGMRYSLALCRNVERAEDVLQSAILYCLRSGSMNWTAAIRGAWKHSVRSHVRYVAKLHNLADMELNGNRINGQTETELVQPQESVHRELPSSLPSEIVEAFKRGGSVKAAAAILGMHRDTLYSRLREFA